ncbi:Very-short-patch mismatch repair endonuclease (G-T specific) [Azospirillum doebereinerae]
MLHAMGFRFRLHRRDLPGTPDVVLPRYKTVVLINGCFWHGHDCVRGAREPRQNAEYWREKRRRNMERDKRNHKLLAEQGWRVIIVWECELRNVEALRQRLADIRKNTNFESERSDPSVG